ncbi:hypothetical protein FACS189430_03380 [Bacteroidia bacterium]|nr:hypothetical protein FACS189430_03380 [Bacteroidia bacterium]
MNKSLLSIVALCTVIVAVSGCLSPTAQPSESKSDCQKKEIYEWRIYTLTKDSAALDEFFQNALIPAYNRLGATVGAFKPFQPEKQAARYLLFVYPDLCTFHKAKKAIWKDEAFTKVAQPFYDSTAPNPLYTDFKSYLCEAFDKIPQMRQPDKDRTLFEFRHYHSPNEEANQRKIKMFNKDEIDVFDKTGINSVCYGEILAGSEMPALIYLTWYKDVPTHDEAWKNFVNHDDWKRISKLPEYAHTATRNVSVWLLPLDYSQF